MDFSLLLFTLVCLTHTQAQVQHHQLQIDICSGTDKEFLLGLDGEEMFYADFEKEKGVIMMPPFTGSMDFSTLYGVAEGNMILCQANLQVLIKYFKDQPVSQDAPQSSIYSRDDLQVGSDNTLICHATRFYPPPVQVRWTKNGVDVTDKSSLSQYYLNRDYTYNQFSHLPFTPQEGDVYTCTVEHEALETPDTMSWDVDVELPSVGPSVFCAVGLAVGLLGVASGTFFLVKGNQCN